MNVTFVFWLTAVYTIVLFGLQVNEFLFGHAPFNFAAINAGYLALMSAYVGGKEVHRWTQPVDEGAPPSFRLPGEWFVGGWMVFFLGASLAKQFSPGRFHYPIGLNTIALEVLGFYLGTTVSRWLRTRETDAQKQLEDALEGKLSPTAPIARRVTERRQRLEAKVLEAVRAKGHVTREEVEALTGLKRSAAGALLAALVKAGRLRQAGGFGDTSTLYEPVH